MADIFKLCFSIVKRSVFLRAFVLVPFYYIRFTFFALKERSMLFFRYYPGYHGSTIPSLKKVTSNRDSIFTQHVSELDGVDLKEDTQLKLLNEFSEYYTEFHPEKEESKNKLYYYNNDMYGYNDAFILYCFLRYFKPNKIIEIGSGYSSGLMIDTCEEFLSETSLSFIDPYSTTISKILSKRPNQRFNLQRTELQNIGLEQFKNLNSNDILFIDTSHVVKIKSDLSYLFFSVLPSLKVGVIIHIHDIWWPWEYPEDMINEGSAYNEIYFVRSFLQFNNSFEIIFFSSFLEKKHKNIINRNMPGYFKSTGKSLWIKKIE